MSKLLSLFCFVGTLLGQGLAVVEIKRLIESDPNYSRIASQSPETRSITDVKLMVSEGDLELSSLVLRRLGLAATPKDEKMIRRDVFKELFPKLIAPATGATANSAGSTSAVSGTGIPMILNVALERGGITQSTKGTVLTLKGNLLGIARGLGSSDAYCLALTCAQKEDILRRFTFGVGFDLTRTSAESGVANVAATNQPVDFSLSSAKEQFDHFTVRFDFSNRRDIRSAYFHKEWAKHTADDALLQAAGNLAKATGKLVDGPILLKHGAPLETELMKAVDADAMAKVIDAAVLRAASEIAASGMNAERVADVQKAHTAYATLVDQFARAAAQKFSHSVEYTFTRPKNQPEISNIRYVGSGGLGAKEQWRATFNAGADFYNKIPAGVTVGAFRDIQLAAQLDRIFFAKKALNVTFSAAAYYQWMKERALIVIAPGELAPGTNIPIAGQAPTLLAPEGSIALGQLKLTFGVRDTKLKIPVSFTFANRSELIKPTRAVLGGQFGISYDFDSLFK